MTLDELALDLAKKLYCTPSPANQQEIIKKWLLNQRDNVLKMYDETGPEPYVVNQKAPGDLKIGDYVFASRWDDCDPGDPWAIGHISELGPNSVVIGEVNGRRYPYAMRITVEQGYRIAAQYPVIEKGPALPYREIARVFGINLPE